MEIIHIQTKDNQYEVYVGRGLRFHMEQFLNKAYQNILIITDDQVAKYYLDDISSTLQIKDRKVSFYIIPHGEKSKSLEEYWKIQTFAIEKGLDRNSLIIALGGGVVGDLTGFVAATFMRGIDYVHVPTTILAHDSSVGGKVAINHPLGKNLIGNFYQPKAVIYDLEVLQSLPEREIRSGFAEVIKHACIADKGLLSLLMKKIHSLQDINGEILHESIVKGIKIKANIVEQDEQERGIRSFLNFGHTLGHGIEAEAGYQEITHGEAIAIGMLYAFAISEDIYKKKIAPQGFMEWLDKLGYPLNKVKNYSYQALIKRMKNDKKNTYGKIRMVLLKDIGEPELVPLEESYLTSQIKKLQNEEVKK